jgi:hypothetical protein
LAPTLRAAESSDFAIAGTRGEEESDAFGASGAAAAVPDEPDDRANEPPRWTPMPYAMAIATTTAAPMTAAFASETSNVDGSPGAFPVRRGEADTEASPPPAEGDPGRRISS